MFQKQQEQRPTEDLQQTDSSWSHIGPGRSTLASAAVRCLVSGLAAPLGWFGVQFHTCVPPVRSLCFLLSLS